METAVAILGAAGRFPGARTLDEYWQNLIGGIESLHRYGPAELQASGVSPTIWAHPDFVPVAGAAPEADLFDADFFGISPAEARLLCPQHRIFLEHCWEALETAGYDPHRFDGRIGVFAGSNASTYLLFNILSHPGLIDMVGHVPALLATDKDYLATRASYTLDLRGPSVAVNTACSTSLVAVHMACQSVLSGECDMALAGAATVHTCPGYLHQEGLPLSPDGRCRPFDASARGSGVGSGAGVVLLKPLAQAIRDGDRVLAVIRGSAINNDGASKVSYTAPSTRGEEEAIAEALAVAGVDARTISYVEAHGTGTALGDPIEVEALTRVFRAAGAGRASCGLGSVKSNFGHLGAAAGMAGLLKVVLALQHRRLPPSLNFTAPNPRLGLDTSPFRVIAESEDWSGPLPLRAGVSSFGVGGSNSHVVVEAAPPEDRPASAPGPGAELFLLSARTSDALERLTDRLAAHLASRPELAPGDVAYTLHSGRRAFRHRSALVARSVADAARELGARDPARLLQGTADTRPRPIAFLFPGGGAQHMGMARTLYEKEPVFREAFDRCRDAVLPLLGVDLAQVVTAPAGRPETPGGPLERESVCAASIFAVSYALCGLWSSFGIEPDTMAGYSTGEYVAATLAGVMTVDEALGLLVERVELIERVVTDRGAMLSVPLPAAACRPFLEGGLSLAGDNGPNLCVLAGPRALIDAAVRTLGAQGISPQMLRVRNGYHSSLLDPIVEPLEALVRTRVLRPPQRPWTSTVTGARIRSEEATDPRYWVRHSRDTVRFGPALSVLLEDPDRILLEVGPGVQMASLARQHDAIRPTHLVLSSLAHPRDATPDREALLATVGRLWLAGQPLTAAAFGAGRARRVALPTYPFQRRRHWIDPLPVGAAGLDGPSALADSPPSADAVEEQPRSIATRYVAPRSDTERALADLWERALGTRPIGIHDDFFELGGTSLLGIQLLGQLPAALKGRIQLADLLVAKTIAALAGQVDRPRQAGLPRGVVLLRAGSGDPVFCPHALLGGAIDVYQALVTSLPSGRPVYGIVAAGVDGVEAPKRSIEEMGAAYCQSIKDLQPHGPYRLIGFSVGGLIAFEIAQQLRAAGDEVAVLALLDARAAAEFPDSLRAGGYTAVLDEFLRPHIEQLMPDAATSTAVEPLLNVARATAEATFAYEPRAYAGRVVFISGETRDNPFVYPSAPPDAFWGGLVSDLELLSVPGNHYSMMSEANAPHVARVLAPLLQP